MQLQASKVDEWWNLIQDLLQKDIQGLFNEHKAFEVSYRRNLKGYQKAYRNFQYNSPFVTVEDSFDTLDFNQYDVGPSGESLKVQLTILA